jgi:26S proteasome non-ATPase regulatory subunit 10
VVLALAQCGGDAAANVLNAKDEEGWAPIHSAASSGNSQIIDILLERGTSTILARYVWAANCTISAKDF